MSHRVTHRRLRVFAAPSVQRVYFSRLRRAFGKRMIDAIVLRRSKTRRGREERQETETYRDDTLERRREGDRQARFAVFSLESKKKKKVSVPRNLAVVH